MIKKFKVWRINGSAKTSLPKEDIGKFYSGDCYIVLYTYHSGERKEDYFLCCWFGKESIEVICFLDLSPKYAVSIAFSVCHSLFSANTIRTDQELPCLAKFLKLNLQLNVWLWLTFCAWKITLLGNRLRSLLALFSGNDEIFWIAVVKLYAVSIIIICRIVLQYLTSYPTIYICTNYIKQCVLHCIWWQNSHSPLHNFFFLQV